MTTDRAELVPVPERFRAAVLRHLVRALLADPVFGGAQILAILGPPGGGKTFGLAQVLAEADVAVALFSAADIEDPRAGVPIRRLRSQLAEVEATIAGHAPAALVIDDADLLLGRFAGTQYTHNLQHLVGELMALASSVSFERPGARIAPVFLIGNDVSLLHAPLLRPGRARILRWEPTTAEISGIAQSLFPLLTRDECERLTRRHPREPLAFFAALREALVDRYVDFLIAERPAADVLRVATSPLEAKRPVLEYTFADVCEVADEMAGTVLHRPTTQRWSR
jgi:SpoVK/Ycf46/Vps4 family AAA+-type ATPase